MDMSIWSLPTKKNNLINIMHEKELNMTTNELIARLYDNLSLLAPKGTSKSAYIAGYLKYAIENIAEHGVESLQSHVDYTSRRLADRSFDEMLEEMEYHGV